MKFTLALVLLLLSSGCYQSITGQVFDGETGKPVEGAVVLVQWTKTHGLGLSYHTVHKIIEIGTDKNGKFKVPGTHSLLVDPPQMVIYKKGYVAWRNDYIFPDYTRRQDFKWGGHNSYKLERFRENYSREQHYIFMGHGIIGTSLEQTPKFVAAEIEEHGEAQKIK